MPIGFEQGFHASLTNVRFLQSLPDMIASLGAGIRRIDDDVLDGMVADAKSRVPDQTGTLSAGITGEAADDRHRFEAHAVASDGQHEDYARFVEFGHGSGVADANYFKSDGSAALRAPARDAGAAPRPFFYPAIVEPLRRRENDVTSLLDSLCAQFGFR